MARLSRSGSPETFSPLVEPERAVFQVALEDRTGPNPTSATIVDAEDPWSPTSPYRNDRSPRAALDPHGFLLDPRFAPATQQGQAQVAAFLGDGEVVDPDGPGPVWEVPVSDPALLLPLNHASPATRP